MLIDNVKLEVVAGNGGRGGIGFRTRGKGPTGGNGGHGGSVYIKGKRDLGALKKFRYKKKIKAENGKEGRSKFRDGKTGEDTYLEVPVGTVVYNFTKKIQYEVEREGQTFLIAKGGAGGKGNFLLRSSTNTTPRRSFPGKEGETCIIGLELKFIADVGLVGLPNAGKSSLLNELTRAKSKVANYPFTTLEPHLGVYYGVVIADIPGLIEGASKGKGLGIKFLRHVERTKVLFHLVAGDSKNIVEDYNIIRKELGNYNKQLLEKKEYIFVTKSDLISKKRKKEIEKSFSEIKKETLFISIYDLESIQKVEKILNKLK
jgi:GTP-binding protein